MFQIWACKQAIGIANTNHAVHKRDKAVDPLCLSCGQVVETTEHIPLCNEAGRVDIFLKTVEPLERWLVKMDTAPKLRDCITQFCQGRGFLRMSQICPSEPAYHRMAISQDMIGWWRFMEGMVSKQLVDIQGEHFALRGTSWKLDKWASGLVTRLLEVTHGQWLYRNVMVHDAITGCLAITRKEEIAAQVEEQLLQGGSDLLEEDAYLLEINLGDLQSSTGEQQEYWLLALKAAWIAGQLTRDRLAPDGMDYG